MGEERGAFLLTSRERLRCALAHKVPDRVPRLEISFWPETLERWRREGLPQGADPAEYFGLDEISIFYFDDTLQLEERVLEETQDYRIYVDRNGVTTKNWLRNYAPPVQLDHVVKTLEDWLKVKDRLIPDISRVPRGTLERYRKLDRQRVFSIISPPEPMWHALRLLGEERGLIATIEEPDLVRDIVTTYTNFTIGMCKVLLGMGMEFDALWVFSDLCYRNGMLFSPSFYREVILPHHRRIAGFCRDLGMYFIYHCDGDVRGFIPLLIEAGVDCIQPLEARAGNDVRELKKIYGHRIAFFGNISADIMGRSKKEIEEEVRSKLLVAKEGGGYIYHSDHSVPPLVSLENYRYVMELVEQYGKY